MNGTLKTLTCLLGNAGFGTLDRSWQDIDTFPTLWGPFSDDFGN